MITHVRPRRLSALVGAAVLLFAAPAFAQSGEPWSPDAYRSGGSSANAGTSGGYASDRGYGYGGSDSYAPRQAYGGGSGGDAYSSSRGGYGANGDAYSPGGGGSYGGSDAYSPSRNGYGAGSSGDSYSSPARHGRDDSYSDPGRPVDDGGRGGYGEPYAPPPGEGAYREGPPPDSGRYYEQNEIIAAGHGFFGAVSQGLGKAVESVFASQGRPNGYILGEDAGGAFVLGLRYGEGMLYTKDAGDHKVFWQGPSVGYDAGAEGSKAMVLVYNLSDPSEIYQRFGGVQGAAYFVGGLSVQFQKYGDVTLAVIRSGVGLRLGANVGYIKYTRAPTWNPL